MACCPNTKAYRTPTAAHTTVRQRITNTAERRQSSRISTSRGRSTQWSNSHAMRRQWSATSRCPNRSASSSWCECGRSSEARRGECSILRRMHTSTCTSDSRPTTRRSGGRYWSCWTKRSRTQNAKSRRNWDDRAAASQPSSFPCTRESPALTRISTDSCMGWKVRVLLSRIRLQEEHRRDSAEGLHSGDRRIEEQHQSGQGQLPEQSGRGGAWPRQNRLYSGGSAQAVQDIEEEPGDHTGDHLLGSRGRGHQAALDAEVAGTAACQRAAEEVVFQFRVQFLRSTECKPQANQAQNGLTMTMFWWWQSGLFVWMFLYNLVIWYDSVWFRNW